MNYTKIYDRLILRAQSRLQSKGEYYEKHHIIPRCLSGTDEKENLVSLTAREHFIAHLCLVKIHPGNGSLVRAAMMMACESTNQNRSANRVYEWLRIKHSKAMSQSQTGKGNSQFGTSWIFNQTTNTNKKVPNDQISNYLESGWIKGRDVKFYTCAVCLKSFSHHFKKNTCSSKCSKIDKRPFQVFEGREQEFLDHYQNLKSMNKALQAMGFKGAISHYYKWARSVLDK
jgi:hypothetical protein